MSGIIYGKCIIFTCSSGPVETKMAASLRNALSAVRATRLTTFLHVENRIVTTGEM